MEPLSVSFMLTSSNRHSDGETCPCYYVKFDFTRSRCCVVFCWAGATLHPFYYRCIFGLLPVGGYNEQCCYEDSCAGLLKHYVYSLLCWVNTYGLRLWVTELYIISFSRYHRIIFHSVTPVHLPGASDECMLLHVLTDIIDIIAIRYADI